MSNNLQAVVAVKEEHVIIDGVRLKKTTAVVATEQGILAREVIEASEVNLPRRAPPVVQARTPPPLPPPVVVVVDSPPPPKRSCCDFCFKCESGYSWYDLHGKGLFIVLLLLVGYLIFGTIGLACLVLYCLCACLNSALSDGDD
ncbi:hypothetical protein pdam_00012900 [Pocillopora damicornis]|uniref:Uncharacterized protein n=1 Tax=Pocillopora damicornis TaxID=46731 RepID=A0A3M6U0Z5_POCDA|nr:hypothetical protein pdam_00012900 [Pocillopora damicornis]